MSEHNIPDELVVNVDETGLPFIPVRSYTLETKEAKQVPLRGFDDQRQITAVAGCTLDCQLLPLQLLYQGKTDRCHPALVNFPKQWDIFHTESHWTNSASFIRYNVFLPYVERTKKEHNLPASQKALLILDIFKAHRTHDVIHHLEKNNVVVRYVPANCTSELQPLDLSVNGAFKKRNKQKFTTWYADRVCKAMAEFEDDYEKMAQSLQIDIKTSAIKPVHARWTISSFAETALQKGEILLGWRKSGLLCTLDKTSPAVSDSVMINTNLYDDDDDSDDEDDGNDKENEEEEEEDNPSDTDGDKVCVGET